jgi:hypothetical protein
VVDCHRRRIRLGECNALSYGSETGTIRFYVLRRVRNGGRHVMNGCLVAMLGDHQCGLGHRCAGDGCDRRRIRVGGGNGWSDGIETGTVGFSVDWRVRNDGRHGW